MLSALLEPFQFSFMVNAMLVAAIVAVPCALLSVFLVLKGWALMGDAMSHAVFPGVVVAYILGIPFAIGAFIAGLFCAIATGYLDDNSRIKRDTIMGIVFSGMFGAGLVLGGVWLSFYLDSAPAPTIVMLFTVLFVIAFVWTSVRDSQTTAHSGEAPGRG